METKLLHAIVNKDGELISPKGTKKPYVYASNRNARLGMLHVTQESEGLEVVPYAPLDDLMSLAFIATDVLPFIGNPEDIEKFLAIMARYDYVLNDANELVHKDEI